MLTRTLLVLSLMIFGVTPVAAADTPSSIEVWKSATCKCCGAWVKHLEANGFAVTVNDVDTSALAALKRQVGVGDELASCHTAKIDGYVVEGHVPAPTSSASLPSGQTRSGSRYRACRSAHQAWSRAPSSSLTTCC